MNAPLQEGEETGLIVKVRPIGRAVRQAVLLGKGADVVVLGKTELGRVLAV
jgi:hypothetical protein